MFLCCVFFYMSPPQNICIRHDTKWDIFSEQKVHINKLRHDHHAKNNLIWADKKLQACLLLPTKEHNNKASLRFTLKIPLWRSLKPLDTCSQCLPNGPNTVWERLLLSVPSTERIFNLLKLNYCLRDNDFCTKYHFSLWKNSITPPKLGQKYFKGCLWEHIYHTCNTVALPVRKKALGW